MALAVSALLFLGLPLALLLLLKANAGVMFLAACAGLVMLGSLDTTFVAAAGSVVPGEGEATVRLAVVLGAIIIASLAFKGTVHGLRTIVNVLIVLLLASMLWLELPALTGASWLVGTVDERAWEVLDAFQSPIIASGLALSLLVLMTKNHRHKKAKHK